MLTRLDADETWSLRLLGAPLAFCPEALQGGAGERPAVRSHGLGRAGFPLALGQEARLGGAGERLAVRPDGLGCAGGILRQSGTDSEHRYQGRKCDPFHFALSLRGSGYETCVETRPHVGAITAVTNRDHRPMLPSHC